MNQNEYDQSGNHQNALQLVMDNGCKTVSFSNISTGTHNKL